jgi:hypothetical protein
LGGAKFSVGWGDPTAEFPFGMFAPFTSLWLLRR